MTARERLAEARLYFVCDARPRAFLDAALGGGADIVQLRDKTLDDAGLIAAAREFRAAADEHGALFILNDRPDLVAACAADGVHIGQDDDTPAAARAVVGPVHATPTKAGRPAAGLEYVEYAAHTVTKPWFAIGGLDAENLHEVVARGARRAVVVRAIADADDPQSAAEALREALKEQVGATQP